MRSRTIEVFVRIMSLTTVACLTILCFNFISPIAGILAMIVLAFAHVLLEEWTKELLNAKTVKNMILTKRTVLDGEKVRIRVEKYSKGNSPAIMLDSYEKELGGWFPYAALTLNYPGLLEPDEVALKQWDGINSFMILYEKRLIDIPHAFLQYHVGNVICKVPICKVKFNVNEETTKVDNASNS